jgi:hypothetical protein
MDKPGFKFFTEEDEKKPVLSGGWVPIAIETKEEESQPYTAKASRFDSLSSLNKDLKESKTTVKSGWTPIVQKASELSKPVFTSKTAYGNKSLKDSFNVNSDLSKVRAAPLYERIELPVKAETNKLSEENKIELIQTFTKKIKEQDQNNTLIPIVVEEEIKPEPITVTELSNNNLIVDQPEKETLITKASEYITKELKTEDNSFQQPVVATVDRNFDTITKKLKYLEQFIAKIAAHGPGGGAGDVITLDHPVKLVTSNYTLTRKDYYVGINSQTTVNITIPDAIGYPGRVIVIKDESGNCSSNPIIVSGTVDNDPGGFILQMDNGGIQMIYREGWRII